MTPTRDNVNSRGKSLVRGEEQAMSSAANVDGGSRSPRSIGADVGVVQRTASVRVPA